ncbi:putative siderophore-binding lipoprotein YfiY [Corynebacterium provencense]|uniref:Putative siderophore-binding lipoprotein YfiY n=1 Tax=Corynebacterium provencense TaxID=1737425 RepID=A0A2Z3YP63_9CORY|nr:ABC transporter substrate-binding protein [Corynebacterium provencense]AWT26286.1 putative siderophore-binding lipoprotein YfiY [Corynebacterium provencense]
MIHTSADALRSSYLLRRLLAPLLSLVLIGGLATACSSDDSDSKPGETSTSDDSYYPHTMTTKFGDVTIEKKPERILALSGTVADRLISLGVEPIAVGSDPTTIESNLPWLADDITSISDNAYNIYGEPDYEAIANLNPDLIVGLITKDDQYDRLSSLAPVITPASKDTNPGWEDQLKTTAEAINAQNKANSLIDDAKTKWGKIGESVPNVNNKTYNFVAYSKNGYSYGNGSVLQLLGLKPNQEDTMGLDTLSKENVGELDADFLVIWTQEQSQIDEMKKDSRFNSLPAVRSGNVVFADTAMANAINSPAPMALDWLLDKLTPSIEALGR